jgi:hypothetical protein
MKFGAKSRALALGAAVVGALGVAAGQEAEPVPPTVDVAGQKDVALTPQQMLEEAKGYLPAMDRGAAVVRRQLTVAREQKDVVKTLCLNDKLNQIDLAIRTGNDRLDGLANAVAQNDIDRVRHQFTVLQVLRDRVSTLVSEANQCIGEETGFVGDARVTVDIDPNIPEADPSEFPDDPLVSEPPVLSSPTL